MEFLRPDHHQHYTPVQISDGTIYMYALIFWCDDRYWYWSRAQCPTYVSHKLYAYTNIFNSFIDWKDYLPRSPRDKTPTHKRSITILILYPCLRLHQLLRRNMSCSMCSVTEDSCLLWLLSRVLRLSVWRGGGMLESSVRMNMWDDHQENMKRSFYDIGPWGWIAMS